MNTEYYNHEARSGLFRPWFVTDVLSHLGLGSNQKILYYLAHTVHDGILQKPKLKLKDRDHEQTSPILA